MTFYTFFAETVILTLTLGYDVVVNRRLKMSLVLLLL